MDPITAIFTFLTKLLDLIIQVRADIPQEQRVKDMQMWYDATKSLTDHANKLLAKYGDK